MYFGARWYNPQLGRWLSPDPLYLVSTAKNAEKDQNIYHYAGNNPWKFVDPDGFLKILTKKAFKNAGSKIGVKPEILYAIGAHESHTGVTWQGLKRKIEVTRFHGLKKGKYKKAFRALNKRIKQDIEKLKRRLAKVKKEIKTRKQQRRLPSTHRKFRKLPRSVLKKLESEQLKLEAQIRDPLRYQREYIKLAERLDPQNSRLASSFGTFQIIGRNYSLAGYKSVNDMINSFKKGQLVQLNALTTFISSEKFRLKAFQSGNLQKISRSYNGRGYKKNDYDKKLQIRINEYKNAF
ncbi:DUF3380 domain-containing protein, partial [Myxococcota bacterium]|nr:DUF3380 domain-containing protein [Myxococcota bacterium]